MKFFSFSSLIKTLLIFSLASSVSAVKEPKFYTPDAPVINAVAYIVMDRK